MYTIHFGDPPFMETPESKLLLCWAKQCYPTVCATPSPTSITSPVPWEEVVLQQTLARLAAMTMGKKHGRTPVKPLISCYHIYIYIHTYIYIYTYIYVCVWLPWKGQPTGSHLRYPCLKDDCFTWLSTNTSNDHTKVSNSWSLSNRETPTNPATPCGCFTPQLA